MKYVPERLTPAQSFHEKARAKLADRDAYALTEPGDVVVIDGGVEETSRPWAAYPP